MYLSQPDTKSRAQNQSTNFYSASLSTTMLFWKATILLLAAVCCAGSTGQLIVLKASETLDSFMKYDLTYPVSQRVKNFIGKSFKIGNFQGFAGNFSSSLLERLQRCPMVAEVTDDVVIEAMDVKEQKDAPRHLSNISNKFRELNRKRSSYFFDEDGDGELVNAYIIDLGIYVDHPQFSGRAHFGRDFTGEGSGDSNGHGTHVAGLVGSDEYGVSKAVDLYEVKALSSTGQGTLSDILGSIEFVVEHRRGSLRPGVANLSLGALKNEILNLAVNAACDTGIVIVVAAGNSDIDACEALPASAVLAITVGAIDDSTNGIALFLNWGSCVDIFAGGVAIPSVDIKKHDQPLILAGTLMAAPLITGMVANLLSAGVSPFEAKTRILDMAIRDSIPVESFRGRTSSPNLIVYNGCDPSDTNPDHWTESESESEYEE